MKELKVFFVAPLPCLLLCNGPLRLDFAPSFNTAHPLPYAFAEKILQLLPEKRFSEVFFTMCGSTAVDTALKIALAFNRARGKESKVMFIGRERGYHGVGFGGVGVVMLCILHNNATLFPSIRIPFPSTVADVLF